MRPALLALNLPRGFAVEGSSRVGEEDQQEEREDVVGKIGHPVQGGCYVGGRLYGWRALCLETAIWLRS